MQVERVEGRLFERVVIVAQGADSAGLKVDLGACGRGECGIPSLRENVPNSRGMSSQRAIKTRLKWLKKVERNVDKSRRANP